MSDEPWKVQQFCYFWIASQVVSADEVTEVLGLAADQATVMGSRRTSPTPVPVEHAWKIRCDRHARIDEQAGEVLRRIEPVADKVRQLVDRGDVQVGLMLVRYFDDEEGGDGALGWVLSPEQVGLLASMGAEIQADEYGG